LSIGLIFCKIKYSIYDELIFKSGNIVGKEIQSIQGGSGMKAIITVIGKDKVGIIYAVTKILAESNVNIEDISQTILQDYFTMMMLVNLSNMNCDFNQLKERLENLGEEINLSIRIQREEIFNYMHNI